MDWLSKIDPNTIVALGGLLSGLLVWSYHKVRGDKEDSFADVIRGLGKQAIHALLIDPEVTNEISPTSLTDKATAIMNALARRLGVPSNAITNALILATAQHVVGDVLAELRAAAGLEDQVSQLNATVGSFPAQLAKVEADALAKGRAWAAENVEIVPATAP